MNWRTDKPTAKLIVAYVRRCNPLPIVLKFDTSQHKYYASGNFPYPFESIIKWADLEEDEGTICPQKGITTEDAMAKLDEKIKSAKKSWEGVDVDKYMDEVRGRDETVTDCDKLEEEIDRAIDDLEGVAEKDADGVLIAHLTLIEHLKDFARHFAKWGAEHRDRFLNWIRDLIKKGIEKPEEALNILKRIDALINDDSLWGEHLKK